MPALVLVAVPPVRMFATAPATELLVIATVADFANPLYVCGVLLTASVAVGVERVSVVTLNLPLVAAKKVVLMKVAPEPVPPQVPLTRPRPPRVRLFTVRVRPEPTLAVAEPVGAMLRLPAADVPDAMDLAPLPEKIRLL